MAVEQWVAGATAGTWTTAFASGDINSLPNSDAVMSSNGAIANSTNLDEFCILSVALGSIAVTTPNYIGVFVYPLNEDGTTYGDNLLTAGTPSSSQPSANYWKANIGVQTGTATVKGSTIVFPIPPVNFNFVITNRLGVAFAASGNTIKYQTFNRKVA